MALTLAAKRNTRRTLFILLTDVTVIEAARRMLLYRRVLTPRHLPLVVTIADETLEQNEMLKPRTAEELYRVGVATELMYERTLLLEELRQSGVIGFRGHGHDILRQLSEIIQLFSDRIKNPQSKPSVDASHVHKEFLPLVCFFS